MPRPSGNRTSRHDRRAVVQAALVSIALHGLVVCWLIRAAPFGGANHDAPRVLQMQLLALPNSRPDRPKPQPDPMQSDRQSDPEPGPESDAVPTKVAPPAPPVGAGALSDADVDSGAAPTNAAETPDPARLRARILDQIAALRPDAQDNGPPAAWAEPDSPVPGLPGRRGWLSRYVGPLRHQSKTGAKPTAASAPESCWPTAP